MSCAHCKAIAAAMAATERARGKDGIAVIITAALWKVIYSAARNGAGRGK